MAIVRQNALSSCGLTARIAKCRKTLRGSLATLSRPVSIHPHYESHEFQLQPEASQAVGVQTLCHFRWWDIPGEICNMHNLTFMVSTSRLLCVYRCLCACTQEYLQTLEDIIEQVMAIASLVSLNGLKFALLTKSDLLEPGSVSHQQLEKRLQLLTTRLEAVKLIIKLSICSYL